MVWYGNYTCKALYHKQCYGMVWSGTDDKWECWKQLFFQILDSYTQEVSMN